MVLTTFYHQHRPGASSVELFETESDRLVITLVALPPLIGILSLLRNSMRMPSISPRCHFTALISILPPPLLLPVLFYSSFIAYPLIFPAAPSSFFTFAFSHSSKIILQQILLLLLHRRITILFSPFKSHLIVFPLQMIPLIRTRLIFSHTLFLSLFHVFSLRSIFLCLSTQYSFIALF